MADDPFDDLDPDAHRDRKGDPFEHLDAEGSDDETPAVPDTGSEPPAGDQSGDVDGESAGARADQSVDVAADAFGDVDVSRGDPFEESGGAFERVDVDSVDPDSVWDRFIEGTEEADDPHETLGGEAVPEDAPDTVEVPKGRFCQTCPHFTSPPEMECTHEGTEILAFVGSDEVRVSNCPIVRERRELGETYE